MRTSLNRIRKIEEYLAGKMPLSERLIFEANMALDPNLEEEKDLQADTYKLIREYGRKRLRQDIRRVDHKLFNNTRHSSFKQKVLRLFNR